MPIQAAQGGQDWHGYHPGAGRSRSNRCATNFPVGTAIALPAQRLSRRRERRLVADAAYHRRPYFAGVLRARATSHPLATLRDMLTLPILFLRRRDPHPGNGEIIHHTLYDCNNPGEDFPGNFSRPHRPAPILFIRLRTMSPAFTRSSAVKA